MSMAFMTTITKSLRPRASANAAVLTHTKALKVINTACLKRKALTSDNERSHMKIINTKTVTLKSEDQKALLGYVLVTNFGELAAKANLEDEMSHEIETDQVSEDVKDALTKEYGTVWDVAAIELQNGAMAPEFHSRVPVTIKVSIQETSEMTRHELPRTYQPNHKRYAENDGLIPSENGEFVKYEDYAEVADKLDIAIHALRKMALALRPPMGREDEIYKAGHIQFDNNVRGFAQDAFKEIGIADTSLRD